MGRKLSIEEHLSTEELKMLYQKSQDPVESRRYHVLWLVKKDYTLVEASKVIGMNYSYTYEIVRRYHKQGIEGLKNGRKNQRPRRPFALLNARQREELKETLKEPPGDGGVWTVEKQAAESIQALALEIQ